ncbi:PrsW family intramembrane metalloprotease [Saccharopolyspora gloriosae]|uniref:RsiW-degrading membrane proteinase PrsW (M82 family) n=1 Tax=Saccharopolyspora gloriosae TaxID=455344 RepID=A0A840NAE9_9PSEU|nr:PrsW family intramembrane metalloprotease [Saccharopolyspora gloriosae]MBB5069206.1 RsiW-degrading membrane proteinase PrsW (M82 family) [Saccharopolyspora gloriosae]
MPALSPRSVLEGRSSNRTPIPFIIGLIVCGICMLLAVTYYLLSGGVLSTVVGGLLALPTVVVLVALVLLMDRLEPEPRVNLVLAFAWGAGVAIVGSFIVNTLGGALLQPVYGAELGKVLTASVVAPVVEESFKGFFLLLMLWFRRFEIDGPTDGLVYAGLCALGFAFVENVLYYQTGLLESGTGVAGTVLVRGVIAPLGHPIYTAMTGLGVAYAARSRSAGRGVAVIAGWVAAVLLHALWNFSTVFGFGGLALAYLVQLGVLITLVVIVVRDRRRLIGLIGTHLPPYIPSGLVHDNDVRMLATMRGRRQARTWARAQAGLPGVRAMSDYQLAATELALLHDHATRATIPVALFHSRRDSILGLMRVARDAFFQRRPQPQVAPPPWSRTEQSGFFRTSQLQTTRMPVYRPLPPPPGRPSAPRGPGGPSEQATAKFGTAKPEAPGQGEQATARFGTAKPGAPQPGPSQAGPPQPGPPQPGASPAGGNQPGPGRQRPPQQRPMPPGRPPNPPQPPPPSGPPWQ